MNSSNPLADRVGEIIPYIQTRHYEQSFLDKVLRTNKAKDQISDPDGVDPENLLEIFSLAFDDFMTVQEADLRPQTHSLGGGVIISGRMKFGWQDALRVRMGEQALQTEVDMLQIHLAQAAAEIAALQTAACAHELL